MKISQLVLILFLVTTSCGKNQLGEQGDASFDWNLENDSSSSQAKIQAHDSYFIGTGIYDITGPAAEIIMAGFAMIDEKTAGIHLRLRSRALVIADPISTKRVAIVSADLCHIYEALTQKVVERLQTKFGDLYDYDNVQISATHTHAGPGGYSHYRLYNLPSLGFSDENFEIIVDGIYQSIVKAHNNLALGTIEIGVGEVKDENVNRAPESYSLNPQGERQMYADDVDKTMTLLKFRKHDGKEIGTLNWYAVHAVTMESDNHLISGDNKGAAAYLFEKAKGTDYSQDEPFIAAFSNSNAGDVSPNNAGDVDGDGDWDCTENENFACTKESGAKQFEAAQEIYNRASERLTGSVDYRHLFVDMSKITVDSEFGEGEESARTCYAAIGISMIAGVPEDGPGYGKEGVNCETISALLGVWMCRKDKDNCHGEKPIVLAMGLKNPPWTPEVLPLQIVKIGQLVLVAVPGEFTTMSGRRLRDTVKRELAESGVTHAVLAGYSNGYAGYVATREEYQAQYYEGASTHFGEWTLAAYQQEFQKLARALANEVDLSKSAAPRDLTGNQKVIKHHRFDALPRGKHFGDVIDDVTYNNYHVGDVVHASFWGGNPRNNPLLQSSYLEVQKQEGTRWKAVAYDWDWETKYIWEDAGRQRSKIAIEWDIPEGTPSGIYRIYHRGHWQSRTGKITPYAGLSRSFVVEN